VIVCLRISSWASARLFGHRLVDLHDRRADHVADPVGRLPDRRTRIDDQIRVERLRVLHVAEKARGDFRRQVTGVHHINEQTVVHDVDDAHITELLGELLLDRLYRDGTGVNDGYGFH
jgi:hypothetical protein